MTEKYIQIDENFIDQFEKLIMAIA